MACGAAVLAKADAAEARIIARTEVSCGVERCLHVVAPEHFDSVATAKDSLIRAVLARCAIGGACCIKPCASWAAHRNTANAVAATLTWDAHTAKLLLARRAGC